MVIKSIAAAVVLTFCVLGAPRTSTALSCASDPSVTLVVVCTKSSCGPGFEISEDPNAPTCAALPLSKSLDADRVLQSTGLVERLTGGQSHGVYEIETERVCLDSWDEQHCTPVTTIAQLASEPDNNVFKEREERAHAAVQEIHRAVLKKKSLIGLFNIAVTLLVVSWPWLVAWLWPSARQYIGTLLTTAILSQVIYVIGLAGWFFPFWSYQVIYQLSLAVALAAALFEAGFIVYRLIRGFLAPG